MGRAPVAQQVVPPVQLVGCERGRVCDGQQLVVGDVRVRSCGGVGGEDSAGRRRRGRIGAVWRRAGRAGGAALGQGVHVVVVAVWSRLG